jgi:hypothetical protein
LKPGCAPLAIQPKEFCDPILIRMGWPRDPEHT